MTTCTTHKKGRGPGTKNCPVCNILRAERRAKEASDRPIEVGVVPTIYHRPGTYGPCIVNLHWPAPKI